MTNKLLLVGTGYMGKAYATVLNKLNVKFDAVCMTEQSAISFSKEFECTCLSGGIELIDFKDLYYKTAIVAIGIENLKSACEKLINSGIHYILVEKPAALNCLDFRNDLKIASDNNIFFLEALMYLHHPQTKMILDIIRSNEIGRIKNINFFIGFDMRRRIFKYFKKKIDFKSSRLTDPNLGGGALNDFACYGLTYSMLIAGMQNNSYFSVPTKLIAKGHVGITGVDENSMANLEFDNGIKANLLVSINKKQDNKLKIIGEKGVIIIPRPIVPHSKDFSFEIKKSFFNNKLYKNRTEKDVYGYEIEYVENCILGNISKKDINEKQMLTLKYLECLDSWKRQIYVKN
jgi:predicted dehydrogenase